MSVYMQHQIIHYGIYILAALVLWQLKRSMFKKGY